MSKATDHFQHNPSPDGKEPVVDILPAWKGITKEGIAELVAATMDVLLEAGNPIEFAERVAAMELFLKGVKADERYIEYVRQELAKFGGKLTTQSGAKIDAIEASTTYDYSANPSWIELDQTIATLDVRKKQLEARLRLVPAGKMLVDEDSGETLVGPTKTSKSTYRVTLAKHDAKSQSVTIV